jgi:NAD(P)-dependent dehydrogenase (short-subunit alcohol dehydrogenase family)
LQSLWQFNIKYQTPPTRLDGKVALVTGGSRGVGRETAKQLARAGSKSGSIEAVYMDLADLESVAMTASELREKLPRLDILVANAGTAGEPYTKSKQGHELHFQVNTLGHFLLVQTLLELLLKSQARVVIVGSHLHSLVSDSTPDYRYRTALLGGWLAYSRSKLGKTWFGYELQRRHPELTVPIVHPGIVNTMLLKTSTPVVDQLLGLVKPWIFISPVRAAQTPLFAAISPNAKGGKYYHNVLGNIRTSKEASDPERARQFWAQCEQLCEAYMKAPVLVR